MFKENMQEALNHASPYLVPGQHQMSEVIVERAEDKSLKVIVFVGDFLTDEQKQMPGYELGGKLFPEAKTLQPNLLVRCALTPLKQGMMSISKHLVDKKDWKNYISSFVLTNQWNPAKRQFENVRVGADENSQNLIYRPIYPISEIGSFTGKQDGVVEVRGLNSVKDIEQAQFYYFPDWIEIVTRRKSLPRLLRQLRDQIQEAMTRTKDQTLISVGEAYLRSCDQLQSFGKRYIKFQTGLIKEAEKHQGVDQHYDEIAERFFEYLELTREDALIKNFAVQQNQSLESNNQIQTAITLMSQILANQQKQVVTPAPVNSAPPPEMNREEYLRSLAPSVTDFQPVDDDESEAGQDENASKETKSAVGCTFEKNPPCKGTVIPNTDPPRCVSHRDK